MKTIYIGLASELTQEQEDKNLEDILQYEICPTGVQICNSGEKKEEINKNETKY